MLRLRCVKVASPADLSLLAVDVSDAVGQRVGAQQGGGALRPVHRHQRVLAHQHLPDVLSTCYPDQRAAQQMSLEHVPVLLPPRCVETRTL